MNIAIDAQNAKLSKDVRRGRKQHLTPERMFKYDDMEQRGKKGGIDAYLYKNNILLPLLYPFYEETQRKHPDKQIWLIEDNAPAHTKASKQCEEERKKRGIKKVDWPANSPDLNVIEGAWASEKTRLKHEWLKLRGAGKDSQEKAREFLTKEWNSAELKQAVLHLCMKWRQTLQKCIDAEGKNNFEA